MPRGSPDWKEFAPQKSIEQLCREGNAFGGLGFSGAIAGQASQLQLWNPANSGVEAYVFGLDIYCTRDANCYLKDSASQLMTFCQFGKNRRLGAPVSLLSIRRIQTAIQAPPYMDEIMLTANIRLPYKPSYIWIPEGKGLWIGINLLDTALRMSFLWFEFSEY